MKNWLSICFLSLCMVAFSQKNYDEFRAGLKGLNCHAVDPVTQASINIQKIEQWVHSDTNTITAQTYYDLGMCYYLLAINDTVTPQIYAEKAMHAMKKYVSLCDQQVMWSGYFNLALIAFKVKQCDVALTHMKMAKKYYSGPKRFWDKASEKTIQTHCSCSLKNLGPLTGK